MVYVWLKLNLYVLSVCVYLKEGIYVYLVFKRSKYNNLLFIYCQFHVTNWFIRGYLLLRFEPLCQQRASIIAGFPSYILTPHFFFAQMMTTTLNWETESGSFIFFKNKHSKCRTIQNLQKPYCFHLLIKNRRSLDLSKCPWSSTLP